MMVLVVTCGPSGGIPEPTLEPTPDTRGRVQINVDLIAQVDALLQDAVQRGIIADGDRQEVLSPLVNQVRPTHNLAGRFVEVSGDSITIRTFVSVDSSKYLSGDLYTFTIGPDTKVLRGSKPVSPGSFMRDEIMTVFAIGGITPSQVVVADRIEGYGARAP
jgi:hypothetical protein